MKSLQLCEEERTECEGQKEKEVGTKRKGTPQSSVSLLSEHAAYNKVVESISDFFRCAIYNNIPNLVVEWVSTLLLNFLNSK